MVMADTYEDFLNHEIAVWGEDYIYNLLDTGYEPVQLTMGDGEIRWSWRFVENSALTTCATSATVEVGSSARVLPFPRGSRL